MKILHILNKLSTGGAQSLVAELSIKQKQSGIDVEILELMPSPNEILKERLSNSQVMIHTLHPIGNVYNPFVIFSIIPYLKGYDIIHVHLFPAQYWVAIAKFISFSKIPVITTEHSTNNKRRNNKISRFIDRWVYHQYDKIVACSDRALEIFQKQYPNTKSISVPNGIDVSKYWNAEPYHKSEFGITDKDFMITMVARFDYPKRQDTIIKALALLPSSFHVFFVGGNPEKHNAIKCNELAENLGITERVHFLYIRSDVPRILKTSDVVVMSSEYEGLSLSSIEGMSGGKPFIASNVNGLKEIVSEAGILFECGNESQLADCLLKLRNDKIFYNITSSKCLARANQYDIKNTVEKYNKLYRDCLK